MKKVLLTHSNDSHQCPILPADFVIFYYGTENEEAIQAGEGSEWGIEVGYSFSVPKQVSCQYGTLMWIIAVQLGYTYIRDIIKTGELENIVDKTICAIRLYEYGFFFWSDNIHMYVLR